MNSIFEKFIKIFIIYWLILYFNTNIFDFLYATHLRLNSILRYGYIDNKKNSTGYWDDSQRNTHITYDNLKKYLLSYYKKNKVNDVLDLGCGIGSYIKYLRENNIDAVGVDKIENIGYIDNQDLTKPYNNPKSYVQTFEVGEHIPKIYENIFFDNICNNAKNGIIMSWAMPGQGGDGHINEKKTIDVINAIESRGFKLNTEETKKIRKSIGTSYNFFYFRHNLLIFNRL